MGGMGFSAPMGQHGTGSRFLPISQIQSDEWYPRIVPIAGELASMTPDQLMAPPASPAAPEGWYQIDFTDPNGPQVRRCICRTCRGIATRLFNF
jgi:hypothetical protein